jgi:hypothetical protein
MALRSAIRSGMPNICPMVFRRAPGRALVMSSARIVRRGLRRGQHSFHARTRLTRAQAQISAEANPFDAIGNRLTALLELIQIPLSTRHARFEDFFTDALGSSIGIAFSYLSARILTRYHSVSALRLRLSPSAAGFFCSARCRLDRVRSSFVSLFTAIGVYIPFFIDWYHFAR